jgi:hypothetical protein
MECQREHLWTYPISKWTKWVSIDMLNMNLLIRHIRDWYEFLPEFLSECLSECLLECLSTYLISIWMSIYISDIDMNVYLHWKLDISTKFKNCVIISIWFINLQEFMIHILLILHRYYVYYSERWFWLVER